MKAKTSVSSNDLVKLLQMKHSTDAVVVECKSGPTQVSGRGILRKLDVWVQLSTWSPWTTIGYEIKVDRQDFIRDRKHVEYLPLCHEFAFVCPSGLIQPQEVPAGCGLLWASANGARLYTRVKAARHEPDLVKLTQLMTYVIMCRSRIVADMHGTHRAESAGDRLAIRREMVEKAEARGALAEFVVGHVQRKVREADDRLKTAQGLESEAVEFAARLAALGVVWDPMTKSWGQHRRVMCEIDQLCGQISNSDLMIIQQTSVRMAEFVSRIRELRQKSTAEEGS